MESWQEEIEYIDNLYFKGRLSCKYRGDINSYLTEKNNEGIEFINLGAFYDIEIDNVIQIEESEYINIRKLHLVEKYEGTINVNYKNEYYDLKPNELFVIPPVIPEHEQTEEGQIHGTLMGQEVVFKLIRIKKKIACIKGAIVSSELLDNGDIREIYISDVDTCEQKERIKKISIAETPSPYIEDENDNHGSKENCIQNSPTGKNKIEYGWYYEEFYNADCTTYWKKIRKPCNPGQPTGNTRLVNGVKEIEYYNSDCSRVWIKQKFDSTSKPICIEGGWTGNERKKDGWIQREFTRKDCSRYWSNHRKPTSCLEGLFSTLLLLFVVLIVIAIALNSDFRELLLGILFIAIAYGAFLGLIWLLVRFASFFQTLFRYIIYALSILFVFWILYSLGNGIKNWKPREAKRERQERIKEETQSEITPPTQSDDGTMETDSIEITLSWLSFDNNTYNGKYKISASDVYTSRSSLINLNTKYIAKISEAYNHAYYSDKPKLSSLYRMFKELRKKNNLNEIEFAQLIVSMVQSIDYSLVLHENCEAVKVSGNREIRRLLNEGYPCESPHPFGIKTPLEFLTTLKGDCDTRTVTLFTILKHFDYDVVILNSDVYLHSMLGISLRGIRGDFKAYKGKKYLFWETTSPNNPIGFLPSEFGRINNWYVALN